MTLSSRNLNFNNCHRETIGRDEAHQLQHHRQMSLFISHLYTTSSSLSLLLCLPYYATPFPFPTLHHLLFPSLPTFSPCKCSTQKHAALKELLALAVECDSLLCCYEVRHLSPNHPVFLFSPRSGPVGQLHSFQLSNWVLSLFLLSQDPVAAFELYCVYIL